MIDSNGSGSNGGGSHSSGSHSSGSTSSPIKQALVAIRDLQARLDAVQARDTEPIAIVGMACRYPGCTDLASFWRLLVNGQDAVTEVPADRWSLDALYHPDPSQPGKMTSRWAGVIDRLDEFDAAFFGISPREAPHVDPRQRLALELMWEALEDAGIPPDTLAGTLTGVFMATLTNDYDHLLFDDLRRADAYSGAGTANSIVANRLSYFLDVRGPSLALDTACSGSLVAVHLACESLRRGESTLALAGGVNVNLMPKSNVFFSKAGALSPSGRCRTFDGGADGMVRSDGAGLVVLKRLSDARRDGDRVIAVIKGSAVNHDGRSNGLMAPNGEAQQAVLTEAYRRAGVTPASVQYIEAHGTGTKLGDPIEVQALGAVLAQDRPADRKCLLGSLKTNVGHTEAAAGIGGLIKTALALRHRLIPPAVHFTDPNPLIPFARLPFVVPREATAWPSPDAPLVAGVSGFGFGGTNAHVVLQDAASTSVGVPAKLETSVDAPPPYVLAFSARTPGALRTLAEGLRDRLVSDEGNEGDAGDICASAARGRTHHKAYRLAVAADSRDGLLAALDRRLADTNSVDAACERSTQSASGSGRLVFVFSGQGSHWPRMGQRLAAREPVFKAALDECDRLFAPLLKQSIVEEIAREANASRLNETALTQPAIFSMQIALVALWRSFGVAPDAVIGHSLGEVAAACAAGAITLEEGVRIVYHRSRLMTRAAGRGRTVVVGLSFEEARDIVRPFEPALAVAGSNGPGTSVIAGDPDTIAELMRALESRGTFCRAIQGVDIAFHSPQMDPLRDELVDALSSGLAGGWAPAISPRAASIPVVSTVTGTWMSGETFNTDYWGRNLREPFLFARGIDVLLGDGGIRACIEISPDAVLSSSIAQCARQAGQRSLQILSSMRRATDEPLHLFEQIARLYELGEPVRWTGIHRSRRHASLPSYPWQRQRFWFDQLTPAETPRAELAHVARSMHAASNVHPLLGEPIEPAPSRDGERVCLWQFDMDATHPGWLADHKVLGDVMVPGAAMLEMALVAARQTWDTHADIAVTEMTFDQPIRLDVPRMVQAALTIRGDAADFTLHSRPARSREAWTKHATARVAVVASANASASANANASTNASANADTDASAGANASERSADSTVVASGRSSEPMAERAARTGAAMPVDAHYAAMSADGLEYGPAFRGIQRLWAGDGEAFAEIQLPSAPGTPGTPGTPGSPDAHDAPDAPDAHHGRYAMHPAMLDAAFQTVAAAVGRDDRQRYLPRGVAGWRVFDMIGACVWCHVRVTARGSEGLTADIDLLNDDGRTVARVDGVSLVCFGAPRRNPLEDALLEERWQARQLTASSDAGRHSGARSWLILADGTGVGEALTARLRANGERVTVARWGSAWRQHDAHIELRAGERGDMDRLMTVAAASGQIDHVVHLWSLDTRPPDAYSDRDTAGTALDRAETLAAVSALHLAQALAQSGSAARLWLTTRGTQSVNPQPGNPRPLNPFAVSSPAVNVRAENIPALNAPAMNAPAASAPAVNAPAANATAVNALPVNTLPVNTPTVNLLASNAFRAASDASVEIQQAAVNGLALTIGQEHPELRCTTIDLDGASRAPAQVTSLTAELLADDRETRVAWRRGVRYAARLVAAPWPRETAPPLTPRRVAVERKATPEDVRAGLPLHGDATYLITGGLGALGLRTAAALARLGARHLVLTGRRGIEGMGDATAASIRAIERTGAAVTIARADISVAADADSLFADVLSQLPPLRGVIHAAGVLDDALIAQQSADRFRTVMAPKMRGTWNLHLHTRALPLDFFVCYSSAASLVGSPGQANYAAGNACMDAIAHYRRALGLPASSINWGAWGEEGMAANPQMHARLAARGVTPIATSDGLALLSRLLRDFTSNTGASDTCGSDRCASDTCASDPCVSNTSDRVAPAQRAAVFGVMPVAWGTFLKQFPAGVPSRFELLAPAASEADDSSSVSASSEAADSSNAATPSGPNAPSAAVLALRALTSSDRRRRLQQMLRDALAAVLGFGASVELGPREKYFDLGMDSLLSVEFRNRLQQTFAITLPATLAFEYPTIETLAEHIDALLIEHFRSVDSDDRSGDSEDSTLPSVNAHNANAATVVPAALAAATRDGDDAEGLDVLPTDEIARLLAAELSEEAVRVR